MIRCPVWGVTSKLEVRVLVLPQFLFFCFGYLGNLRKNEKENTNSGLRSIFPVVR